MKTKFHFIKFTSIDNRQMQMYCSPTFFGLHKHVNVNLQLHTNVHCMYLQNFHAVQSLSTFENIIQNFFTRNPKHQIKILTNMYTAHAHASLYCQTLHCKHDVHIYMYGYANINVIKDKNRSFSEHRFIHSTHTDGSFS